MKTFWRWTGTLFFALAFVFLTITGFGTSLPIEHRASCSATYQALARDLQAAVENDDTSTRWRSDIATAFRVSGNGPTAVWRETDKRGQTLTYRTAVYDGGTRLVRTIEFEPGMPFAGSWTYDFTPADATIGPGASSRATRVTISEDGLIYNPFFRFMARYVFGNTQTMRAYLADLGSLTRRSPEITCTAP